MARSGFQAVSRRIHAEKALKHAGTAEVKLHVLDFSTSNQANTKNVERLARLFNSQRGYSPGEPQNRIPAVIDEADLHAALAVSGLSHESLLTYGSKHARLDFPPGFRLACLRGRDRVQAFEEVSRSPDPHWVVDLFIAGLWPCLYQSPCPNPAKISATKRREIWLRSTQVRSHQEMGYSSTRYARIKVYLESKMNTSRTSGGHALVR